VGATRKTKNLCSAYLNCRLLKKVIGFQFPHTANTLTEINEELLSAKRLSDCLHYVDLAGPGGQRPSIADEYVKLAVLLNGNVKDMFSALN
jgi:hypothetical protein